jgi:glycosyltransferase involved in cell wall biosynthesis
MNLTIVIPAYNEEKKIANVLDSIPDKIRSNVIVVNDGSKDKTEEIVKKFNVRLISHKVNKGYGAAIKTGFNEALKNKPDVIITFDADAQHYASDLNEILKPIKNSQADIVIGSRFLDKENSNIPYYRRLGISFITYLINFLLKTNITDAQSGFRAYKREILRNIQIKETNMSASLEILFNLPDHTRVKEIPIKCDYSNTQHSTNPISHGLQLVRTIIKLYFKRPTQR